MTLKNWTPEEDAILTRMMQAGDTYAQVTAALPGRNISAVKCRAYRLNCSNTRVDGRWHGRADATLRQMWSDGATIIEIADRLGVAHTSVRRRIERINLPPRKSAVRAIGTGWAANDLAIERSARQATASFERHYRDVAAKRGWRVWQYAA
jgi:hypothetical protein